MTRIAKAGGSLDYLKGAQTDGEKETAYSDLAERLGNLGRATRDMGNSIGKLLAAGSSYGRRLLKSWCNSSETGYVIVHNRGEVVGW